MKSEKQQVEVIIVGCGPVGAVTANLLGQRSVKTLVLERETGEHGQPRAFSCDDEALRIYQSTGLSQQLIEDMARCDYFDFSGINDKVFATVNTGQQNFGYGYGPLYFFYQPALERTLREGLKRFASVEVRLGFKVEGIEQLENGKAVVSGRELSTGIIYEIETDYILGCDGSHSSVRRLGGIEMDLTPYHQQWLAVSGRTTAKSLRINHTRFVCNPDRPTFVGVGPGERYRVELMLLPGEKPQELEQPEKIRELIAPYVDPKFTSIERAAVYTFNKATARHWRKGNIFLLGDAAHQLPPFMGQGLSSGLRDAANLSWKLELVLREKAPPAILDSYELERKAHTEQMQDISVKMGYIFLARSRVTAWLRDNLFRLVQRIPRIKNFISRFEFKPQPGYPQGLMANGKRDGAKSAQGLLFPQPQVEISQGQKVLLDEALGENFTVLTLEEGGTFPIQQTYLTLNYIKVLPQGSQFSEHFSVDCKELIDCDGKLAKWFRQYDANIVVLRPDRFVFWAGKLEEIGTLERELRKILIFRKAVPVHGLR